MTDDTSPRRVRGRPPIYPFATMAVGDTATLPVPTAADVKRIARSASQYGIRHNRMFACVTDRTTRVMTVTRSW